MQKNFQFRSLGTRESMDEPSGMEIIPEIANALLQKTLFPFRPCWIPKSPENIQNFTSLTVNKTQNFPIASSFHSALLLKTIYSSTFFAFAGRPLPRFGFPSSSTGAFLAPPTFGGLPRPRFAGRATSSSASS